VQYLLKDCQAKYELLLKGLDYGSVQSLTDGLQDAFLKPF
jgi:hypothetical protein